MNRTARRSLTLAGVGLAALLLPVTPALAHVTVGSADAAPGGYAVLTFRVPTESDTASTTALAVVLPADHPIASVSVQPHPGWSFTVTKAKLNPPLTTDDGQVTEAVSQIHWTADSAASAIKPGEFDQFNISAGPLPEVDALTFKAIQNYSDGTVVNWIEQAAPGSTTEPEHPAPTLHIAAATPAAADSNSAEATAALVIAIAAALLGAGAFLVALRSRRTARPDSARARTGAREAASPETAPVEVGATPPTS
ncbi:MAG TPA: YcnI family protein [Jatrophihabitans sp.]|nr:YcnI family protein [Jatrophihabitans sp.]